MVFRGKLAFLKSQILSFKTKRKIIVIESDDWGSERMPDVHTRNELGKFGLDIRKNPFTWLDTLERVDDILSLEMILDSIQKKTGKTVKITTNFIVANPDYSKIKENNYNDYAYEVFTDTYRRRDGDDRVFEAIQKMNQQGYFKPQFHGREHLNISMWLDQLRKENKYFRKAFDLSTYGIDVPMDVSYRTNLMAAYEYDDEAQRTLVMDSISDGMALFYKYFGTQSDTAVAPRHVWNDEIEMQYSKAGIKGIQTSLNQLIPSHQGYILKPHYTGEADPKSDMVYTVRSLNFEPSYDSKYDWISKNIKKIKWQFLIGNPVIIGMHRLNFVGGIEEANRTENLKLFKYFIENIIDNYPDVEFLSSDELITTIVQSNVRD